MMTKPQRIKGRSLINTYYDSIDSIDSDGVNELIAIKDFLETLIEITALGKRQTTRKRIVQEMNRIVRENNREVLQ